MLKQKIGLWILFILMFLLQILVCNHIMIFHLATPIVFIYFIIRMAYGANLNLLFTLAFLGGLIIDIFSDTLGMNALSATILAGAKRPVLLAYVQRDDHISKLIPSVSTLGTWGYSKYLFTMLLIYCFLIFSIEYFSVDFIIDILLMSASSALLSFIILLGIDSLISRG